MAMTKKMAMCTCVCYICTMHATFEISPTQSVTEIFIIFILLWGVVRTGSTWTGPWVADPVRSGGPWTGYPGVGVLHSMGYLGYVFLAFLVIISILTILVSTGLWFLHVSLEFSFFRSFFFINIDKTSV